jgi:uncharacterized protein YydD (DUF2326 family)
MQLRELLVTRSSEVVRCVKFKMGLNLILDKPTASKTQSGNSVGKTTVLRLIDYCLGSDGNDIWQDSEFKKNVNNEVYDFLHSNQAVTVSLVVVDKFTHAYTLTRSFGDGKKGQILYRIEKTEYKSLKSYNSAVKELLFGVGGEKPTLRQLTPKFIRSSPLLMSKTLKFLNAYSSDADYESVHLFLFGFFDTSVLEERPKLQLRRIELERDWQALERIRTEGEIEQLLLHLQREIEEIESSRELKGEVPEIASRANAVTRIRAKAAEFAATLSRIQGETSAVRMAIRTLGTC